MSFLDFLKNLFGNDKKNARLITKDLTKRRKHYEYH